MAHKTKRKRPDSGRFLNILILIIVVLIVFEGRLLINMFSKEGVKKQLENQLNEALEGAEEETEAPQTETSAQTEPPTERQTEAPQTVSSALVPKQSTPVDDSYFSDAVFIGDSRVEGFRAQSGITTGTFLTGVGMDVETIGTKPFIATENGMVTVYDALQTAPYSKVYIMLGTNELGFYDFNEFEKQYKSVLETIQLIQPNAIIYVMDVIYVEEALVTTGDYVNNDNVREINKHILNICEENGYYFLDLNEIFDDGSGSLLPGASIDGVHLYDRYCQMWLDYLRDHYVSFGSDTDSESTQGTDAPEEGQNDTSQETGTTEESQTNSDTSA
ncbi:GDSL-type esterase/lipase family protein [Murimonas intestini]|uniref:GDSL-like lipase/acylhydrolase family protein n=1 Tax=Murimonas intestini TaxID=1337051 RepID=A0AB73T717_9FIRM|nr:GDSL-type esterase/lipase family protein [Murimonas intestini]MCR1841350.1 GDSL-type esterase/lipase family protein [Murimonas intestini]MCR1866268.1 GDSL-type esterase/lipase family protein [Murimonas intestini]MCR1882615.1 GDSL-type esterase/lipase family protein [Murimonas intestini]